MHILVTGKNGQVATALRYAAESKGIRISFLSRPDIDLSKPESLATPIRSVRPDVIVSTAAYTAVDRAEVEADLAMTINGVAAGELAHIAAALKAPLIHLSTDYVFAGDKAAPYAENDQADPINVYGRSKLAGEKAIIAEWADHAILRTSWVYSPYGSNFVRTMLRLSEGQNEVRVVNDQLGSPTYAPEIARAILAIAARLREDRSEHLRGIFNLTASGETTWAGFAEAIFSGLALRHGPTVKVNAIPTVEYPTLARRPANSRLSGEKLLRVHNIGLEDWMTSLDRCLDALIRRN